ncbi:unnamed protein product [marine sediment metagenome]|uniref:Uncharacterized protein n=1 Tax=marine sediment metagenome TaxID=412755 RepID=X1QRM1_9ZZZZ
MKKTIFGNVKMVAKAGSDKERKLKSQIRKQKKLIKELKNTIRIYAPYMKFSNE